MLMQQGAQSGPAKLGSRRSHSIFSRGLPRWAGPRGSLARLTIALPSQSLLNLAWSSEGAFSCAL